jgi:hypothetical protein
MQDVIDLRVAIVDKEWFYENVSEGVVEGNEK